MYDRCCPTRRKLNIMKRPGVGIGVIIQNSEGQILVGKRKGSHSPYYSIPGGHLENGETFEEAAIREVFEETNLKIRNPKFICVTNNLRTFKEENKHYVSITMYSNEYDGICEVKEPDKCEEWIWCNIDEVPEPQFDASEFAIACLRKGKAYIENQG